MILIPKMKLILGQGWMKGLYALGDCQMVYSKSDDSSRDPKRYSGLAGFLLKSFGKKYSIHAEIAKKLRKMNEKIYSTVMVGIV